MKLLVLGGTRFVGRAVVTEAVARGADVTTVSRGESGEPSDGVTWLRADRTVPGSLPALAATQWDAVIDTWDGAPEVVETSAALLAGSARWYGYVSSRSVYLWPPAAGIDESAPLVDAEPDGGYPADKRGGEIAVESHFEGRSLLARAGLIVGPYEDAGRLTWWLQRAATGGRWWRRTRRTGSGSSSTREISPGSCSTPRSRRPAGRTTSCAREATQSPPDG